VNDAEKGKMMKRFVWMALASVLGVTSAVATATANEYITVASTTSTANSGLFDDLLPQFTKKTGIEVRVVAVGTGQALKIARNGDADVLFVHHRPSEEAFVAEGFGVKRYGVMYNDFVIVGPTADPAHVKGCASAKDALNKISQTQSVFVSRGDDSGTNKREKSLWKATGVASGEPAGSWYRSTGSGMGATLNTAAGSGGYALSDRGTWISFKNKQDLSIVCEGDPSLFNPYGVMLVNPAKHPHVKANAGQAFIDWLVSSEGQAAIGGFRLQGETLFTPSTRN